MHIDQFAVHSFLIAINNNRLLIRLVILADGIVKIPLGISRPLLLIELRTLVWLFEISVLLLKLDTCAL